MDNIQAALDLRIPKCTRCGQAMEDHQRASLRCPFIRDGKKCYRRQHTYLPRVPRT